MILETERLILKLISKEEANFYFELFNDKDWIKFIGDKKLKSIDETEKYLKEAFIPLLCKNGLGFYTVYLKENKKPVGASSILKRDFSNLFDIGYGFLSRERGKGYATEATIRMIKYAKENLNQTKVMAYTKPNNENSQKLLKKLNFTFLGLKPVFTEKEDAVFELEI